MTAIINGTTVTMTVDEFIEYQRKTCAVPTEAKPYMNPFIERKDIVAPPYKWNEITCGSGGTP